MQEILTRAGCFVAIIILGFVLRRMGVLKREEAFPVLSTIVIKITLPAAIITSFAGREIDPAMLMLVVLGFACGIVLILLGFLLNLHSDASKRAFEILNLPSYNIGNFTMPFAQSFLGPTGVIVTSLFDTGNAMITLGTALGVAKSVKEGSGFSVGRIVRALSRSIPFLTYIVMMILCLLHLSPPGIVMSVAQTIAGGNAFLAMLMIGVGFRLEANWEQLGQVARVVGIRYIVAIVLAALFYFCLPFALEVRQTLVILVFSPPGSVVPAFTGELGEDVGLSAAINSVSILLSIATIVALLTVML